MVPKTKAFILNFNFNIEVNRPFNTENRFFLSLLINDMSGIFIIRSITIQNPLYHSKDYFLYKIKIAKFRLYLCSSLLCPSTWRLVPGVPCVPRHPSLSLCVVTITSASFMIKVSSSIKGIIISLNIININLSNRQVFD